MPPNVLLSCDAGVVHPQLFASKLLAQLPEWSQFWADAQQHAERAGYKEGEEKETFAMSVINSVLWVKLCTIFVAILDAACTANNWIVIDRTKSKSPSAE